MHVNRSIWYSMPYLNTIQYQKLIQCMFSDDMCCSNVSENKYINVPLIRVYSRTVLAIVLQKRNSVHVSF